MKPVDIAGAREMNRLGVYALAAEIIMLGAIAYVVLR